MYHLYKSGETNISYVLSTGSWYMYREIIKNNGTRPGVGSWSRIPFSILILGTDVDS